MPRFCGVIGCVNKENKVKKSFFRLPAVRKHIAPDLTHLRRLKWLAAIRREDLTELKMKYLWVCEDHFISGMPADYRDVDNPDWVPSIKMGYEKNFVTDCLNESFAEKVNDANCLNAEDKIGKQEKRLFIIGQIIPSCSKEVNFRDKLRTIMDNSLLNSERLLSEKNPRTYSKTNNKTKALRSKLLQHELFSKENPFKSLLMNLSLIEKPNTFWGISPHSNIVICARWNEDYICEKKVVIDNLLVVKAFLKELEINLSKLMSITCIKDISNLLKKVESYEIP